MRKILIIKLAAMGDVMFASPLVENLRFNYPDAQVHWLGDSWTEQVLNCVPGINKTLFFDRPWLARSKLKAYLEIPLLVSKLRKEKYDLAIIPHRSGLAFKLARLSLISKKVGFGKDSNLDTGVNYDSSKHEIERNLDLLRALGLKIFTNQMAYFVDDKLVKAMAKKYLSANAKVKYICVSPGGGKNPGLDMPLKRWPKEKYLDLIKLLQGKGFKVVLVGAESDRQICDFIAGQADVINLCSMTSLNEAAAIIKSCSLFVGNDSGLLYIASALDVPTLGIYGPTDPKLLAPLGDKGDYASCETGCSPCYTPNSTVQGAYKECQYNHQCMKELKVEDVYKYIQKNR